MKITVVIPVKNPGLEIFRTLTSLVDQTDKQFSVLYSDNYSDTHNSDIHTALKQHSVLHGIHVEVVKPPCKLGRVQHWNWACNQVQEGWIKPLFCGDTIEPRYMTVLKTVKEDALFTSYRHHRSDGCVYHITPKRRWGCIFIPPCATAFTVEAFLQCGGYDASLRMFADSLLATRILKQRKAKCIPAMADFYESFGRFSSVMRRTNYFEYFRFLTSSCATI